MPLSDYMAELLRNRIAENAGDSRALSMGIPMSRHRASDLVEEKLTASEPKLFEQHWSPHTLRHSWITIADQKVKISDPINAS